MSNPNPKKGRFLALGSLSSKSKGQHWTPPKLEFETPERVCNSASFEPYVPADKTVYRAGSVDANRPRVRGV